MSRVITVNNKELTKEADFSTLKSDATAAASTISVYSVSKFDVNDIVLIGEFGQEGSEIIAVHATTSPSGTTVTLASTLVKDHPKDTKVYIIPFDQVEFSHATTEAGIKSVLTTIAVDAEKEETTYSDTSSSGYYFVRWYNSIAVSYGDYSDGIPYTGHVSNTVGYVINQALDELHKGISDVLTYDILIGEVNSCLRYVRGKLKRWSNVQEFDYVVGQMNRGEYNWALPTAYYDKNSNRSMLQVKVGERRLDYQDKIEFDEHFEDVIKTTVATQASSGATSLVLTSSDDFPETGTISVYVSNTLYEIDYTANDQDTNTLTTEALPVTITAGKNVWMDESEGTPKYYSVWDGYLYVWPLISSTDAGKNVIIDFYTDIVEVDSDSDIITLARHDMIKYWLKWQIRNITENNGKLDYQDGDWMMFNSILADAVRREGSGQKYKLKPFINGITYRGEGRVTNQSFDVT